MYVVHHKVHFELSYSMTRSTKCVRFKCFFFKHRYFFQKKRVKKTGFCKWELPWFYETSKEIDTCCGIKYRLSLTAVGSNPDRGFVDSFMWFSLSCYPAIAYGTPVVLLRYPLVPEIMHVETPEVFLHQ